MKHLRKKPLTRIFIALCLSMVLCFCFSLNAHAANITQYFDTKAYADTYPDLKSAFGYDADALLNHYFTFGINEGRTMNGSLDVKGYRVLYPDLDAAFGDNWKAYAEHYASHGVAEGRRNGVGAAKAPAAKPEAKAADVNSVIQKKGSVSDSYMNAVRHYWGIIPENQKQDFVSQGWRVEVTSNELHLAGYSSRILAITSFENKTIFLSNRDSSSLVHEMGHYIDWRHGMCHNKISDDVYQSEKGAAHKLGGGSTSNYGNKQEYLAECYWLYFKNNAGLKANCPQTYAFIQQNMM